MKHFKQDLRAMAEARQATRESERTFHPAHANIARPLRRSDDAPDATSAPIAAPVAERERFSRRRRPFPGLQSTFAPEE